MDAMIPLVSVVMGVYNGEKSLELTLDSVLGQTLKDFEFIVVDDGSTDRTSQILAEYAEKDSRIRVVRQENKGLTLALIHGCSLARSEYIARQDSGDFSLPGRLSKQLQSFESSPGKVMVASGAVFQTPGGEKLYEFVIPGSELDNGIRRLSISRIKGPPHHGGTMYRREAYLKCGGYRPQFRVAQDMDLWLRLSELGKFWGNEETLYCAVIEPGSISITRGPDQFYFGNLAIESAKLRRSGQDDCSLLENLNPPSSRGGNAVAASYADYYYFLGSVLAKSNRRAAKTYFDKALEHNPFHLKAHLRRMVIGRK